MSKLNILCQQLKSAIRKNAFKKIKSEWLKILLPEGVLSEETTMKFHRNIVYEA